MTAQSAGDHARTTLDLAITECVRLYVRAMYSRVHPGTGKRRTDNMPKVKIVDGAIEEVKDELLDYLKENPDTDELPDLGNDLDYSGRIHEIVDGSVPIYTKEIEDIMYLHGNDVEQAFDDAGIGDKSSDGWPSGWKAAAIYCYIDQEVRSWYSDNAQDVFDEWKEKRQNTLCTCGHNADEHANTGTCVAQDDKQEFCECDAFTEKESEVTA